MRKCKAAFWAYGVNLFLVLCFFVFGKLKLFPVLTSNLFAFYALSLWLPGLFALFFAKREGIRIVFFVRPNRFALLALFLPLLLFLLTFVFALLFHGFEGAAMKNAVLSHPLRFAQSLAILFTAGFLLSLGGEVMWRGYLFEKFKDLGFWKSSLFIGLLWGFWTAPATLLLNSSGLLISVLNILFGAIGALLLSPLLLYVRIKSKSLIYTALFLSVLNAIEPFFALLFNNYLDLTMGVFGLSGFAATIALSSFLFILNRKPQWRSL